MSPTNRRALLRAVAAGAAPLAGCLGGTDRATTARSTTEGAPGTAPPTDTPTPTAGADTETPYTAADGPLDVGDAYRTRDGWTVTVTAAHVAKLIRTPSVGSATHVDVGCLADQQFVVLSARATDPDGRAALTDVRIDLAVDGVRYPLSNQQRYWAFPPGSDERPGRPAFAVPVESATDATAVWLRDGEAVMRWRLPDRVPASLGAAPAFEVRSLEVPGEVTRGDDVEAAVTVANTGDRDGRFVAEYGAGPISDHGEVVVEVPAGEAVTHERTLSPHYPEGADDVEVTLDWGCERHTRSVTVTE